MFKKYARTEGHMSPRDLLTFLHSEQREQVSLGHAVTLINKYEVDETGTPHSQNPDPTLTLTLTLTPTPTRPRP